MNLTRPSEVSALLRELGFHPRKSLGQHFLIDANVLRIMLRLAEIRKDESVFEVGPGLGVLTEWLARYAARVVAVEKDAILCDFLRRRFADNRAVELVHADVLEVDLSAWMREGFWKVVSNLPYAVASRFLVNLALCTCPIERAVVTIQREVALRLAASPRQADYGLLSIIVQCFFGVKIVRNVPRTCFLPPPRVDSSIVVLEPLPTATSVAAAERSRLLHLLQLAFARRRKQLGPFFRQHGAERVLAELRIDARARAEELSPTQWLEVSRLWPAPPGD